MFSRKRTPTITTVRRTSPRLPALARASLCRTGASCSSPCRTVASSALKFSYTTRSDIMKLISFLLVLGLLALPAFAQTSALRGQVTDESGAVVPGAKVTLSGPAGLSKTTVSANDGSYSFLDLPPGNYTVHAFAPGLMLRQPAKIAARAGAQTLNLLLNVA